jgi:hypothetical protein
VSNREKALEEALRKAARLETAVREEVAAIKCALEQETRHSPILLHILKGLEKHLPSLPAQSTETPEGWLTREQVEAFGEWATRSTELGYHAPAFGAEAAALCRMALYALQQGGGR